jgi:spore coat protein A
MVSRLRASVPVLFLSFLLASVPFVLAPRASAQVPGGTLDPSSIPKYVTPLVIPPVMHNDGTTDSYDIAVRQFQQQILPGGIWNTASPDCADSPGLCDLPATTVWSYGPADDDAPDSSGIGGGAGVAPAPNSQFNYPAYTVEVTSNQRTDVRWINDLVDSRGRYLPHLLPIDQTLHWANPPMQCRVGFPRTDCSGKSSTPYTGPVPIVTHVHGAHVGPESDGYPEAWWLPAARNIPQGYATSGTLFDDTTGSNPGSLGYADFSYPNSQPATTLWYHDHTLGMTRSNVYAGPAGFWLVRGGSYDGGETSGGQTAVLPGPAPTSEGVLDLNVPGDPDRSKIREIPIVIQDRSFNTDGSLFYPADRAFFEGLAPEDLRIKTVPEDQSDVAPIWNPEAFFNVMVVNGVSWPKLEVAQDRYRFRLLNGCNSRFLNLSLVVHSSSDSGLVGKSIPFYQIGAEQGFVPQVVRIVPGERVPLPGDGTEPASDPDPDDPTALLMGLAERADVIVDFQGLPDGTVVQMVNTAPDEPFGGFPELGEDFEPADEETTGQVMRFVVDSELTGTSGSTDGTTTDPADLVLNSEVNKDGDLGSPDNTRQVSLNELESEAVCVPVDEEGEFVLDRRGRLVQIPGVNPGPDFAADCAAAGGAPFGPTEALLGTVTGSGASAVGNALKWTDTTGASTSVAVYKTDGSAVTVNVTEIPDLDDTEDWEIYNFTADAHPIHLHLVRFQVKSRTLFDGSASPNGSPQPWEEGFKDTVIAYPGEITTVRATFDIAGLYVWHCHIVEHEDNEMMRPYCVSGNSMCSPMEPPPPRPSPRGMGRCGLGYELALLLPGLAGLRGVRRRRRTRAAQGA